MTKGNFTGLTPVFSARPPAPERVAAPDAGRGAASCFSCGGTAWTRVPTRWGTAGERLEGVALRCAGCGRERRVRELP